MNPEPSGPTKAKWTNTHTFGPLSGVGYESIIGLMVIPSLNPLTFKMGRNTYLAGS